jgi:hypothetical protein
MSHVPQRAVPIHALQEKEQHVWLFDGRSNVLQLFVRCSAVLLGGLMFSVPVVTMIAMFVMERVLAADPPETRC